MNNLTKDIKDTEKQEHAKSKSTGINNQSREKL